MPSPYDYGSSAGYDRARADWISFPDLTTLVRQGDLDRWDQALKDLKNVASNVKDFLAVGDGVTDSTTPIENAWVAAKDTNALLLPPGNFVYNGTGLDGTNPTIIGAGPSKTFVTLGATSRFLNISTALSSLHVSGITFVDGVDVIRSTFTGVNVINHHVIEDCRFTGYTGAAISNNASDMPYVKVNRCIFRGANYTTCIGIALSGLTDSCSITDCSFWTNRVHIKAREAGNSLYIRNCDLLRFGVTAGSPRVDVWIVPKTSAVSAGDGLTIESSKFGNEFIDAADYRILYADEGAGADNATKFPNLADDSTGYIVGHSVSNITWIGSSGAYRPLVYSTTPNLIGCNYGPLNVGGFPDHVIQFRTVPTADRSNTSCIVGPIFGKDLGSELKPAPLPSNGHGVTFALDPNQMFSTQPTLPLTLSGGGDMAGYAKLLPTVIRSFSVVNATLTDAADALGGIDASELNFTSASGIVYAQLTMGNMTVGRPVFIEFDVKVGAATALTLLRAGMQTEGGAWHWRRIVNISSVWSRHRFLYVPRTVTGQTDLVFETNGTETGKVQVGRVRVYHAREPVNAGVAAANADTSGATLPALETEVNELKATLRALGLIAT